MKLWGPMLTGLSQGFENYQRQQEDLAYTRQERANQLAAQQLANQAASTQNQMSALQLADLDAQNRYFSQAADPTAVGDAAAARAVPATRAQPAGATQLAAAGGIKNFSADMVKPYTPQRIQQIAQQVSAPSQYDDMFKAAAQKYGVDWRELKMRAAVESGMHADAVGPATANGQSVGLMQVEKGNAARAGFDPRDPQASIDWAAQQLAGYARAADGDQSVVDKTYYGGTNRKMWGKNTNQYAANLAAVRSAMGNQSAGAAALDQAQSQPSPAAQLDARVNAGVDTPVTAYQGATSAQQRMIGMYTQMGQRAQRDGNGRLAMQFFAQADKLQGEQIDLQRKTLDVQKSANDETAKLAASVGDQTSYDGFLSQLQQNPAMQAAARGLNLTGDYTADRQKIATLADRALTIKDQADLADRRVRLQIEQQREQREQAKFDAPRIAQAQAQAADQQRQQALAGKGVPFAPSIAATAPVGMSPEQVDAARKKIQTANNTVLQKDALGASSDRDIMGLTTQLLGLLDKQNPVTTGGWSSIPGVSQVLTKFGDDRQLFEKISNNLISRMQQSQGAAGGGRSSFTAAMYANLKTQKPNVDLSPETNRQMAMELYAGAAMETSRREFVREYMQANPDAPIQNAQMLWSAYEQSLGPAFVVDPQSPTGFSPNYAGIPTRPDGQKNAGYRDWREFFKHYEAQ
ncbi:transglycosylase SLT domain-containing protein [Burkholderia cenocepacia]|uniref:transglycosylase SLT domain-containing protein n=1 Tax=Burkholderia cenocepacia TaxID=95486 RepID=UPI001B9ACEAD|nr:transglycosylase SLT domain-containing protein [Burkholderia cenocepacia]MBR8073342.1 transglycosylase SLT domain-containing protein [Burkholderia cenocepacia]